MASGGHQNEFNISRVKDESLGEEKSQLLEKRIFLVGRTGSGKSALANNILGKKVFQSFYSPLSVTDGFQFGETVKMGNMIKLVDTPGFCHTTMPEAEVRKCIISAVDSMSPGPHAILFVCRVGRYSDEEQYSMEQFIKTLSTDVLQYTIFVLTYGDILKDENVEHYVDSLPLFFKSFIQQCGERKLVINNFSSDCDIDKQNIELLSLITKMSKTNNPPFFVRPKKSNSMFKLKRFVSKVFYSASVPLRKKIFKAVFAFAAIYFSRLDILIIQAFGYPITIRQ